MAEYEIIKRTKKKFHGIQMGNTKGKFLNNVMRTKDPVLARDIRQRFGQDRTDAEADVLVARVPNRSTGNTFTVGIQFDENGNRRE